MRSRGRDEDRWEVQEGEVVGGNLRGKETIRVSNKGI